MKRLLIFLLVLLLIVPSALAQAPEPTPAPTPTAPVLPDVAPEADSLTAGLEAILSSAGLLLGVISFFVVQLLKWALPANTVPTERIYAGVVGLFSVIYIVSAWAGLEAQLADGVNLLNALAGPVWQFILLISAGPALYRGAKAIDVPVLADKQGDRAFKLDRPIDAIEYDEVPF